MLYLYIRFDYQIIFDLPYNTIHTSKEKKKKQINKKNPTSKETKQTLIDSESCR